MDKHTARQQDIFNEEEEERQDYQYFKVYDHEDLIKTLEIAKNHEIIQAISQ